ncbi:MAG: dihydroxyacetone kinase subunit DhaL [Pseudomonadota bacterium]
MADNQLSALIDTANMAVQDAKDELTKLDQAIGDGDHGLNMARGFEAIAEDREKILAKPLGPALQAAGMTLVMKVGGASGPLYGSLLMSMGKAAPEGEPDAAALTDMLGAGIDAVKKRGKSDRGAKTMLDVLIPVYEALADGADIAKVRQVADEAAEATIPMVATKGRASYLGERSAGHMDPGAASSRLVIQTVCDVIEGAR